MLLSTCAIGMSAQLYRASDGEVLPHIMPWAVGDNFMPISSTLYSQCNLRALLLMGREGKGRPMTKRFPAAAGLISMSIINFCSAVHGCVHCTPVSCKNWLVLSERLKQLHNIVW